MHSGVVVHGQGKAKQTGFPTANVVVDTQQLHNGVFLCTAVVAGAPQKGLAIIGVIPYDTQRQQQVIEVYLLDFEGDLYGQRLEIELEQKLRDIWPMSESEVAEQAKADVERARKIYSGIV